MSAQAIQEMRELAERTRLANEERTPLEWSGKASDALRELRASLSKAIALGNADVPKDGPMSPASATVTAAFVHVGQLTWALEWLERALIAERDANNTEAFAPVVEADLANVHDGKGSGQ